MGTSRISINIDEHVKKDAQAILSEIGLDLTTAIDTYLRAIIREEQIPFVLRTGRAAQEDAYRQYVSRELAASKAEANDSDVIPLDHDELLRKWDKRREARRNALHD